MSSEHLGLAMEVISRDTDECVFAVSGELSERSARLVTRALADALSMPGRVLVDVSGLRLTSPTAIQVFPSVLADARGWPGARLGGFGADPELTRSLTASRVSTTRPAGAQRGHRPAAAGPTPTGRRPSASSGPRAGVSVPGAAVRRGRLR